MVTSPKSNSKSKGKNYGILERFQRKGTVREMIILGALFFGGIAAISAILYFLWLVAKPVFVWVLSTAVIAYSRTKNAWKFGFELHNYLTFALSFSFGFFYTASFLLVSSAIGVKIRPDTFNGALVNFIILLIMAAVGKVFFGYFGPDPTSVHIMIAGMSTIFLGVFLDFAFCFKFVPIHWVRNVINHTLSIIINYFVMTTFGVGLAMWLVTI
jgi:hypothetical protein